MAHAVGLLLCVAVALLLREPLPARDAVWWGVCGGVSGGFALVAFYRSLAIGTMGINAPMAAIITATLPVILSASIQGAPKPVQVAGFRARGGQHHPGVASAEVWPDRRAASGWRLAAGVGFGIFLVAMRQAGTVHIFWPLAVARASSMLLMGAIALLRGGGAAAACAEVLRLVLLAGAMDTIGNALFMFATQHGRLDVAGALSSLYPVTTVVLARVLNGEKIHPVQAVGSVLALVGAADRGVIAGVQGRGHGFSGENTEWSRNECAD